MLFSLSFSLQHILLHSWNLTQGVGCCHLKARNGYGVYSRSSGSVPWHSAAKIPQRRNCNCIRNTEILPATCGSKLQGDHQTLSHVHTLQQVPWCVRIQADILWYHGTGFTRYSINVRGSCKCTQQTAFLTHGPRQSFRLLVLPNLAFFAWDGGLSPRFQKAELWCVLLTTAFCICLTRVNQSRRDVKSSWKFSWF